ncbi:chemotaxis protein CheX [Sulfurospirillum arcachonense]|uniref:chemotaxis protein CheX n=1 Tax=Sulfurospirillum arcachonense TaxID=57666 RepID=UPI0004697656|nr:chemotaxis protein CheX [Sulfurospirillum arcachonense]
MIDAIDKATTKFCSEIIGLKIDPAKTVGKNFYGAAIAMYENNTEYQWYLLFKKSTLNEFAKVLLFEDNLNEDDLDDLVKEVANMIIGSAKVILEEKNINNTYKISTPDFLGHIENSKILELEEFLLYKIKNRTFIIGKRVELG